MSDDAITDGESGDDGLSLEPIDEAWLNRDAARVEALAREQLAAAPDDFRWHAWLGLAMQASGQFPGAQRSLERAFTLLRAASAAAADEARESLEWELQSIADRLLEVADGEPEALRRAAELLVDTLGVEHGPALRALVEASLEQGDPAAAGRWLKRVFAVDKTDAEGHYLAARLFAHLGKKAQVLSHLEKAIAHADGGLAVRRLTRIESDFDGLRADAEFAALTDSFPTDAVLRPIYVALDAGDCARVVELAAAAAPPENPLDLWYPLREALEVLAAEDAATWQAELERVQEAVDACEAEDGTSAAFARFSGEA